MCFERNILSEIYFDGFSVFMFVYKRRHKGVRNFFFRMTSFGNNPEAAKFKLHFKNLVEPNKNEIA